MSTITPLSPAPSRQRPGTFSAEADVFLSELPPMVGEINAAVGGVNTNATIAAAAAVAATAQVALATAQAALAVSAVNAPVWISGATYAIGDCRWSPLNFMVYRRKIAGAGTIDPSLDVVNWLQLSAVYPSNIPFYQSQGGL